MWIRTVEKDEPIWVGLYLHTETTLRYWIVSLSWPLRIDIYVAPAWK